jgi:hypothetical protein
LREQSSASLALSLLPNVASREERVLELLRSLELEEGSWRYHGRQLRSVVGARRQQLVPFYFLFCADAVHGDRRRRFRELAVDVLRIYGLRPELDVAVVRRSSVAHGSTGTTLIAASDSSCEVAATAIPYTEPSEEDSALLDDERTRAPAVPRGIGCTWPT